MDHTQNAVAIFNKLANLYQEKYMDVGLYHDSFDLFCDNIKKENPEILELACGPGNITKYLLNKRPDFKIFGIDLAPNMIELAKTNNPEAAFQVMDCRDIGSIDKNFDAIMCGFCLPYLSKEECIQIIQDCARLLSVDGILYISTMEDDYGKSGFKSGSTGDQIYMYFHEAGYLSEALETNGFRIIELLRQDFPTTDGVKTTDLVMIAGK